MVVTADKSQQEAVLRQLIGDRVKAIASKNVEETLKYYAADLVQFSLAPPLQIPVTEARDKKALQAWFESFSGDLVYEVHELKLTVGDDVALGHCFMKMGAVSKPTGEQFEFWFRLTLGFCKYEEQWLIIHEHESVPFYMDGSFKAATDLKP